ncbi:DUF3078 domain-containing protein [Mucilaginibacter robiniae]|uniref:DUF3078 domain-containing protein n=1 Tax=Mucilaginibacter robiniae TaxID=2728022 RepID=A0A7L5DXR5_9SPHI|nr:DUF3078 domain-containing protein [Mucilaginibacter robiniae]QJD95805.1 DUF3078 domain-containing protein [Mucilaginibacter robiniae]
MAQQTDSLRRDSLRRLAFSRDSLQKDSLKLDSIRRASIIVDTNLLNQYRIEPRRNALPRLLPAVQVRPEQIPVTMLDYKVSYWHKNVIFGLNFSQSQFSNNWSAGGVNSFALNGNLDYKLEYNKSPLDYTSELILQYGRSKNKDQMSRKTNDRIFWDNKIATQLSKKWYFFASVDFESQFDKGFQYNDPDPPILISRFMAPGYITESVGFEYKPNKAFDLRIGTGTARQTFVLDTTILPKDTTYYGIRRHSTFKNEIAFQVVSTYDKDIATNLHLNTRYALFIPYGRSLVYIDHRLDATLSAKVNRWVSVSITGTGLYDYDTSHKIQGTENLTFGILYKFP